MVLAPFADLLTTTDTRYGRLTHFRDDDPIGVSLSQYGEWAQLELALLAQLIAPGDQVVDIGANVGTHTLAFASFVGATGQVLAIEPQPVIHALLARNVAENGLSQVTVEGCAISDAPGEQLLAVPDYRRRHNSGVAMVGGAFGEQVRVPTRNLDGFGLERCALIKLDVEGWEKAVLAGAEQTLARCQPVLYAECNSMEKGWELVQFLGERFAAWLHSPAAFNPANFKHNAENRFGIARETSLLFVPRAKVDALRPRLQGVEGLSEVTSLDVFAAAFTRATRFGEAQVRVESAQSLARRVQQLEHELQVTRGAPVRNRYRPRLKRRVHVLVPVYNGYDDFRQLSHSLFNTHPEPTELLRFVFINDASPDPRVAEFLATALFDRPDVVRLTNEQNRGFIGTVNRGFELFGFGPDGTDVIILNSDTQVHGNVFAILQDVADRVPNVASVTPLTNCGTIASLWNWPEGRDLGPGLSPEAVARAIEEAQVPTTFVGAPTGVGFCMYMTKKALDAVGGLDPVFGKGYGEENHWCQSAAKRGFLNVITPEAFVYHHGSQSFGDELKRKQLERNLSLLGTLHPNYHREVAEFVDGDPLRDARFAAQWAVRRLKKAEDRLHTFLFVLHTDPAYFGGGTERHVMALTDALLAGGKAEVMHLFPDGQGRVVLNTYFPSHDPAAPRAPFLSERFDLDAGFALLTSLARDVDTLHVHHALGWPRWFAQVPALFAHSRKLLTLHDYYAGCPSIRMMSKGRFCGVPSDLSACNKCLATEHGYGESSIEAYRTINAQFMQLFDRVIVPSEAAKATLLRSFEVLPADGGVDAKALGEKIEAVSNFLFTPPAAATVAAAPPAPNAKPRVVYLGAFVDSKGGHLFSDASQSLRRRGFEVEIWGALGLALPPGVTHRPYAGAVELRRLAAEFPVDVVVVPAVWPETFSFTTFEAVLELGAPVVVGPYGNPPELVRRHGIGVVLEALSAPSLVEGVSRCLVERATFAPALHAFREASALLTVGSFLRAVYGELSAGSLAPLGVSEERFEPSRRRVTIVQAQAVSTDAALRYRLVDQTNAFIKDRLPKVHAMGKWMVERATRARAR